MMSFSFYLLALMPLSYAFSLDTQTEFWNYTSSSLADTTSSKCKKAYSAQIDCDPLLADLVAASEERYMLPDYDMDMFFDMCTATCHDSVKDYINNVQESCSYPEDAALAVEEGTSLSFVDPEFITVPVETIANLFLYTLMRSCAKEDGENCYVTESSVFIPDYACKWDCATAWYWNRHTYPYYNWHFGMGDGLRFDNGTVFNPWNNILVQDWFDRNDRGWKNIVKCGLDFKNGSAPFDIGITGLKSSPAEAVTETSTSTASASTTTASQVSSGTSSSPAPTGAAVKLHLGHIGLFAPALAMALGLGL